MTAPVKSAVSFVRARRRAALWLSGCTAAGWGYPVLYSLVATKWR